MVKTRALYDVRIYAIKAIHIVEEAMASQVRSNDNVVSVAENDNCVLAAERSHSGLFISSLLVFWGILSKKT